MTRTTKSVDRKTFKRSRRSISWSFFRMIQVFYLSFEWLNLLYSFQSAFCIEIGFESCRLCVAFSNKNETRNWSTYHDKTINLTLSNASKQCEPWVYRWPWADQIDNWVKISKISIELGQMLANTKPSQNQLKLSILINIDERFPLSIQVKFLEASVGHRFKMALDSLDGDINQLVPTKWWDFNLFRVFTSNPLIRYRVSCLLHSLVLCTMTHISLLRS